MILALTTVGTWGIVAAILATLVAVLVWRDLRRNRRTPSSLAGSYDHTGVPERDYAVSAVRSKERRLSVVETRRVDPEPWGDE